MTAERDRFLQRVRQAVADGNRAAPSPTCPRAAASATRASAPTPSPASAMNAPPRADSCMRRRPRRRRGRRREPAAQHSVHRLLGGGGVLDLWIFPLDCRGQHRNGRRFHPGRRGAARRLLRRRRRRLRRRFSRRRDGQRRTSDAAGTAASLSLLPPIHVAVADRSQLLSDLFDLFEVPSAEPPSCLSLITGPSKTGDIELRLVTGVHGPGEIHVVLIDRAAAPAEYRGRRHRVQSQRPRLAHWPGHMLVRLVVANELLLLRVPLQRPSQLIADVAQVTDAGL